MHPLDHCSAAQKTRQQSQKPGLSTNEHEAILIIRDRHEATADHILADLEGPAFAKHLKPIVGADAVLVADGR